MLQGKWPEPCIRCKREFESGMSSRTHYERSFPADYIEKENYQLQKSKRKYKCGRKH